MKLLYLLKKDLVESRKAMSIYGAALFFVMLWANILPMILGNPTYSDLRGFYLQFFTSFLFLGGFIIASMTFTEEMYGKSTQHNWLMLPASPQEKLSVKVITTSVIYPIALLIFISVAALLIEGFNTLVFNRHYMLLNPLNPAVWRSVLNYIVLQAIFLMGSTYFRKAAFIKTVLVLGLLGFIIGMIAFLTGWVVFDTYFTGMTIGEDLIINNHVIPVSSPADIPLLRTYEVIGKVLYWVFLAPFCWIVSYLRIREVQAYDAV